VPHPVQIIFVESPLKKDQSLHMRNIGMVVMLGNDERNSGVNVVSNAAIPAARIKVLCDPIINSVRQPVGYLHPAFEPLF